LTNKIRNYFAERNTMLQTDASKLQRKPNGRAHCRNFDIKTTWNTNWNCYIFLATTWLMNVLFNVH